MKCHNSKTKYSGHNGTVDHYTNNSNKITCIHKNPLQYFYDTSKEQVT
ncbi:MAG: hypothetical protein LUQ36_09000 [Methanoregula sp.]|nr:hypothetical protein [Methanoregula sp.]